MILFRYLSREILLSMSAVTLVLMVIIMSSRFVKYLAEVASGDLAPDMLLLIMLYRMPNFLELIVPLGLFIGILLSYGRLYVDSEMTVMSACGMSERRLIAYTMIPATLVALFVGYLSLVLSPAGIEAYSKLVQDAKAADSLRLAVEGRFRVERGSGRVTYIESLDRESGRMGNIFVAEPVPDSRDRSILALVRADGGRIEIDENTGQRYLALDKGSRAVGEPGEMDFLMTRFELLGQWLETPAQVGYRQEVDSLATLELLRSDRPADIAALQWRISLALLVPIVALIAVALSKTDHRRGRYGKLFPAFFLYMVYLVALNALREAVANGQFPPMPGLWLLHAVFLLVGLMLIYGPDLWRRRA